MAVCAELRWSTCFETFVLIVGVVEDGDRLAVKVELMVLFDYLAVGDALQVMNEVGADGSKRLANVSVAVDYNLAILDVIQS